MLKEFKEFALRGNVVDMAVGIVIGAAFSTIVKSLVDDILMPPIGVVTGGVDFSNMFVALNGEHYDSLAQARQAGAPILNFGVFVNNVIAFLIVAVALFLVIKAMNHLRRRQEEAPATEPPPSQEVAALARDPRCIGDGQRSPRAPDEAAARKLKAGTDFARQGLSWRNVAQSTRHCNRSESSADRTRSGVSAEAQQNVPNRAFAPGQAAGPAPKNFSGVGSGSWLLPNATIAPAALTEAVCPRDAGQLALKLRQIAGENLVLCSLGCLSCTAPHLVET